MSTHGCPTRPGSSCSAEKVEAVHSAVLPTPAPITCYCKNGCGYSFGSTSEKRASNSLWNTNAVNPVKMADVSFSGWRFTIQSSKSGNGSSERLVFVLVKALYIILILLHQVINGLE